MTPAQTAEMIRVATQLPHDRFKGVKEALRKVNHSQDPTCQAFNLRVDDQAVSARARVLDPPRMMYNGVKPEGSFKGAWNVRHNRTLLKAVPIYNWVVLNLSRTNERTIEDFVSMLKDKAKEMGIFVSMENLRIINKQPNQAQEALLTQIFPLYSDREKHVKIPGVGKCPLQLIVIVMPDVSPF